MSKPNGNSNSKRAKNNNNRGSNVKGRANRSDTKHIKDQQPKKDSDSKRINLDNARVSKFKKGMADLQYKDVQGMNDISWYSKNPEMLIGAGSIPFAAVTGAPIGLDSTGQKTPGLLVMDWAPATGLSRESIMIATSTNFKLSPYAINQAGKAMYSYVVHANSRNYTYEFQDLMMLIMAGSQPFAMLASMIRAYGFMKTYNERTLYQPDTVIKAMGFSASDLRDNLSQMWFDINEMIARTSQIWIPNVMPVITRWMWLNSNIYTDAESQRSQMYMFNQNIYWMYSEVSSSTGGSLVPLLNTTDGNPSSSDTAGQPATSYFNPGMYQYDWATWKRMFNILLDSLLNSEDRGIIMGDILNAYGAEKILAMSPIPVDYRVEPVYNREVLTQIENANVVPGTFQSGLWQDSDGLHPAWNTTMGRGLKSTNIIPLNYPKNRVINFHFPTQPTPADIMIATRLSTAGRLIITSPSTGSRYEMQITSTTPPTGGSKLLLTPVVTKVPIFSCETCGTEIVNQMRVFGGFGNNVLGSRVLYNTTAGMQSSSGSDLLMDLIFDDSHALWDFLDMNAFDWHPFLYKYEAGGVGTFLGAYGDYDNYSVIDTQMLTKLNTTALYSEFGVPQI